MTSTPKFGLGMMASGSLQKEVIFNEAIILLEALTARTVLSKALTAPPASPSNGDMYLITAVNPSGDWTNKSMNLAFYFNGWRFIAPPSKMKVYIEDESRWYTFSAGNWTADAVTAVSAIDDLSDVTAGAPLEGQFLCYDSATHQWKPKTGSTVVDFGDLADVDTTGLLNGQVFVWDQAAGKLKPGDLPEMPTVTVYDHLSQLQDVDLANLVDGSMLSWDVPSEKWVVGNPVVVSINDINDVITDGAQVGDVLTWNGAAWGPSSQAMLLSFLNVVDGPRTFEGAALKLLRVDATESELEYVDPATIGVPTGGTAGQVLTKTTTGSEWGDAPVSVPLGGTTGQILTKVSAADGDAAWANPQATGGAAIEQVGAWSGATLVQIDTFDSLAMPGDYTYYNQKGSAATFENDPDAVSATTYAMQFGDIDDSQSTYIEFAATADTTNNELEVHWRAEAETNFDKLHVIVDGTEVTTLLGSGVGGSAWKVYTGTLSVGPHTIRLLYSKDGSASTGWDNFRFSKISRPVANSSGYMKGDVVLYSGSYWLSTADNNLSEPGVDANWLPFVPVGGTEGQMLYRSADGFVWGDPPVASVAVGDLTDVDLTTAPTDQQALIFDATDAKWRPGSVAASGGSSSTVEGSIAHDYFSPTLKVPTAADLPIALTSSGITDASADKNNCLLVAGTGTTWASSGSGFMRLKEFAPGTTFEVITLVFPMNSFGKYDFNGLVLRDANNNKNLMFGVSDYNTTNYMTAIRTKLDGFDQSSNNGYGSGFCRQPIWLRAVGTGDGNVTFSVSENGHIWFPMLTESLTAHLTSITHVGVGYTTRLGISTYNEALRGLPCFYFHAHTVVGSGYEGVAVTGGTSPSATHAPMSVELFATSTFLASEVLLKKLVSIAFTLPTNLTGSLATLETATTAAISFTLKKNGAAFGTVDFAAGATVGTFTMAATTTFATGDVLSIVAPSSADATAAGLTLTLAGSY